MKKGIRKGKRMEPDQQRNLIGMILLALLGGGANQAHLKMNGRKIPWLHFMLRAPVSCLIGFVCYFLFPHDSPWSFVFSGLLSWMGANGISLLIRMTMKNKSEE